MAVTYNVARGSYTYAYNDHPLAHVLAHFGVREGRADELLSMFAHAYRKYYGGEASEDQLRKCCDDYAERKTLPTSVLSVYCRDNNLLPDDKLLGAY